MQTYRVTSDEFSIGHQLQPSVAFFDNLPKENRPIETILESVRPHGKPSRNSARYVFENIISARYWAKTHLGKKIYIMDVREDDILHRGDWKWPALMLKSDSDEDRKNMAKRYWIGEETENPVIELLVRAALVAGEDYSINPIQQFTEVQKRFGMPSLDDLFKKK